nr:YgjP-like metallopeptidase domain-containing protein [Sphingomonas jejuensis]
MPRFGDRTIVVARNRRARSLKLSVDPASGTVRLGLPWRQPLAPALAWVETRRGWVEAQLASLPVARPIAPGMTLCIGGDPLVLDWSIEHPRTPARRGDRLVVGGPRELLPARVLRHLRVEALATLTRESRALADANGLDLTQVSVGDPRRRWGSCAADGHIRYSWRLIMAPAFVRHSVVAHEVAHLREHHHGPSFHAFADRLLGGSHVPARDWLAAHGAALHWFGRTA